MYACKTTEPPEKKVNFLTQADRPDWKTMIDSGKVGYYSPYEDKLLGLTSPPHNKGMERISPYAGMSLDCREYLMENGQQSSRLEFLVDEEGGISQFYVLKSAGPCDQDAAIGLKRISLVPGQENQQDKAALVHLRVGFVYMHN